METYLVTTAVQGGENVFQRVSAHVPYGNASSIPISDVYGALGDTQHSYFFYFMVI